MKRVKLDRVDLKILQLLQSDGRMSNVDLAERVGISAPPCLRRMRALEEAGYIAGYHAIVNPEKLDYKVVGYIHVGLSSHAESDLNGFAEMVEGWPQVRECVLISGDVDFLLKVVARDWDHYQNFITSHLTRAPNVATVRSSLVIKLCKSEPGVPISEEHLARGRF